MRLRRKYNGRAEGLSVLVTGAARGIGAASAALLAKEGARVIAADIQEADGERVVEKIVRSGGSAAFARLDVTDEESWRVAVDLTVERHGDLNVLVNNAGVFLEHGVEGTSAAQWDYVMATNLKGPFLGTRAVIPAMRRSGGGSIINVSSVAGIVGNPYGAAYSASKGGLRLLTKATALEFAQDGIRCNSVHPGPIDTELVRDFLADASAAGRGPLERVPMNRIGQPAEVAAVILLLATDESSFMTGSEVVVDGGRTAG
jgi:NAD(P)-dependent dehydrogenase (short-subunit alcohol dehydrogenase family)